MKRYLLMICLFILVFITGCSKSPYDTINYVRYLEKLNSKDDFALVIGSSECSACAIYEGTMEIFKDRHRNVKVFFIDVSKLSNDEYNDLKTQTSFDGTPTTIFFKSGEMTDYTDRIDGSANLETVERTFKKQGYIN